MKKITFMLLATLIAVASWAGVPVKDLRATKAMPLATMKAAPAKQFTPTKKAAAVQLQAPVANKMAQKAKAGARKAPKKAGLTDLLYAQWMLCSEYYTYDSEAGQLVESVPAAGGTPISFSLVDAQTVSIEGFINGATEPVTATFAVTTDEELLADGIIATISIANGQKLMDSSYGTIVLQNFSGEEGAPILGYVYQDGYVFIDALWAAVLADGQYAGYAWTDYCSSVAVPVNGTMAWGEDEEAVEVPVVILQDDEAPKTAVVYNFAGEETAVDVTMKEDKTFVINEQPMFYYDSEYGYFYVSGLLISGGNYYLDTLTGVGTEKTLTFNGNWMLYSPTTNSIYDSYDPATITLTDGEFLYPVIPDVAATPADPEILKVNGYDASAGYGSIVFVIPTTDVDGNDLKEDKLFYQLYSDIDGDIQPITFTPEICEMLEEDMTIIPYTFTDNWDFADNGSYKVVFLNYKFDSMYDRIGVKSIYTGGDETNESNIVWEEIEKPEPVVTTTTATFNFNEMDVPTSSSVTTDGDITESLTLTEENVALTISPKVSGNSENRFWSTNAGPQLRVYNGTLTFEVPEGSSITQIVFNHNGYWGGKNNAGNVTADSGEIVNAPEALAATWTGEAQSVAFTIGGNSQINSIVVTVEGEGGDEPIEPNPDALVYDFEDGTMQGWTTIDADGDGFDWTLGASPSINTVNDSDYSVYSESYSSDAGALTPDNFLVSPQIKLDGSISFYACAQDGDWAAEHFAVAVSTAGNTDAADFTNVEEWTMTASRVANPSFAPGKFRGPRKTPGAWYKYTVDLSSYEGADGYVAIRHFDCTDNFYIVVDDIEIKTSHVTMPDFTISPAEGVVESLSEFEITFNNYDITVAEDAAATLTNTTTETTVNGTIGAEGNTLTISFDETTEGGEYILTVAGISTAEGEPVELNFNYTIEAAPEVVVLPEGVEAETWYFSATASESSVRNQEVAVAIDGSDIYIQGINVDYLPEAWVKGTIEGNTATFPTGQYFGAYEYNGSNYDMFFVGTTDGQTPSDVVFTFDNEAGKMTTDQYIVIGPKKDEASYYEYYTDVVITRELPVAPDLVELPEGVEPEDWAIDGTYTDSWGGNNIVKATEVAFDGSDIYVKGLAYYFEDAWLKGTINAETGIATFPTGQFVGEDEYGWEFMVGSDDAETLCDIEFAYDAEAKTLTQLTAYIVENADTPDEISPYGWWTDMLIYAGEPVYEEAIEAPEGLETETYVLTANVIENGDDEEDLARKTEASTDVTFDFNSLGTEEEPWPVSSGTGDNYDPAGEINEPLVLTEGNVTLTISPAEEGTTPTRFWKTNNGPQLRVYNGTLTFEAPEGYEMTQIVFNAGKWNENNSADSGEFEGPTWTGNAQSVTVTIGYFNEETGKWVSGNSQINSINVTVAESGEEPEPVVTEPNYSYQMEVGFDGQDVYFKGVSDDTADMWLKGTLSEDGKTVTIPANQYMGEATVLWFTFPYYFTAVAEDGETMEDIVLNYDAENNKFTTDQMLVLHDGKRALGEPYQTFTDVVISKMEEFAATPADPSIDELSLTGSYPKAYFNIPAEDVDGNALLTSKLFYTVWVEEDGKEKPFTAAAGEYKYFTEDLTEIPYTYEDSYDIYRGGRPFYFNPVDVVTTWPKIGIQSIYYGGGECNKSNIVWEENPAYDPTTVGISSVNAETGKNVVYFDLQGRRVAAPAKGLYIANGKKVVIK